MAKAVGAMGGSAAAAAAAAVAEVVAEVVVVVINLLLFLRHVLFQQFCHLIVSLTPSDTQR